MTLWQDFRTRAVILLFVLLVLAGVGSMTADQVFLRDSHILPQVYVAHVDVGGLTRDAAEKKLTAFIGGGLPPVVITDSKEVWLTPSAELNLSVDIAKSIETAYSLGREQDVFQRWKDRWNSQSQPVYLPLEIVLDRGKLAGILKPLAKQTDRTARSAALSILTKSKEVALTPSIEGRTLNVGKTVDEALNSQQLQLPVVVELKFDIEKPPLTDAQFAGINTMLASFSTYFKPWDSDRNANLKLAAERIHGKRLNPGEVFSYNEIVGNRTRQQGFHMAPVILDGKLVPDWGGGVCQVSSTLYNAALLANLDIVDRTNHGRAIGYVPLGFDATVVDGQIDFKFKNNLTSPILIYSSVTDNELFFFVLGDAKDLPPSIELDYVVHRVYEPVDIKQPDPTIDAGKEVVEESPQRGFRVSTYRIRKAQGKEERQLLATDDYDPVNNIVKVGTKPVDGQNATTVETAKLLDKLPAQTSGGSITLPKPASPLPIVPQKQVKR